MSIAGLFALFNVIFVVRRLRMAGAVPLLGMLVAVTIWTVTYSLELASADFQWQYFWLRIEYFGIPNVSTFFLIFALEYTQQTKLLERKWLYALWIIPVASVILAWTNGAHGLIWSQIGQSNYGSFTMLHLQHGIFFWIMAAYSYVMLFSGSLILVRRAITGWAMFKFQPIIMIGGVLVTWIGNLLYLSGTSPIPELDWTPMTVILSGMIYSIGLLRFGILDIMPIAGESVLESMEDIVFVLNEQNYIVFVNKVFEYYTGMDPKSLIGKHAEQALAPWPELQALTGMDSTIRTEISLNLKNNHGVVFFDAKISKIRWKTDRLLGRVIRLDDNTERHFAENRRRAQDDSEAGSAEIPMIVVFDNRQESIIEVNRKFLINLGMERNHVIGRSLLDLGVWDHYERAEFRKRLLKEKTLESYKLQLANSRGVVKGYSASAQLMGMGNERYVVVLIQKEAQDALQPA
jgi:PAS domain S-box-containing protein